MKKLFVLGGVAALATLGTVAWAQFTPQNQLVGTEGIEVTLPSGSQGQYPVNVIRNTVGNSLITALPAPPASTNGANPYQLSQATGRFLVGFPLAAAFYFGFPQNPPDGQQLEIANVTGSAFTGFNIVPVITDSTGGGVPNSCVALAANSSCEYLYNKSSNSGAGGWYKMR